MTSSLAVGLQLGASVLLGFIGVLGFRRFDRRIPRETDPLRIRWGFWEVVLGISLLFCSAGIGQQIVRRFTDSQDSPFPSIVGYSLSGASAALVLLVILSWAYGARPADLGIRFTMAGRYAVLGLLGYLAIQPCYQVVTLLNEWIYELVEIPLRPQAPLEILTTESVGRQVVLLVVIVIVAPASEEILFRGIFYSGIRRYVGRAATIFGSSLIFALFHWGPPFLPVFVLGLLLGALYEKTRSLAAPVTVHAAHNAIVVALWVLLPGVAPGVESASVSWVWQLGIRGPF